MAQPIEPPDRLARPSGVSSPPVRPGRRLQWFHLYYLLAAFDVLTVLLSLSLSHSIQITYANSIQQNQVWAQRLVAYSELGRLASAVNAPGNDVFDSRDVERESNRLSTALSSYRQQMAQLTDDVDRHVAGERGPLLRDRLGAIDRTIDEMVSEAQLIFSYFDQQRPDMAGQRMATMDRKYAEVTDALASLRVEVAAIQQRNFAEQQATADRLARFELLLAGLVLLMITAATFYGHKLARQIELAGRREQQRYHEGLRDAEERLTEVAYQDAVTRLANRPRLMQQLSGALERVERDGATVGLIFLDLDNFKLINDSLGHAAGDQLLRAIGERLLTCVRPEDTVARLGGDEFAVVLERVGDGQIVSRIAERMVAQLRLPFNLDGREVVAGASVGIALSPPDPAQAELLLLHADMAMYHAKRNGRGRVVVFEPTFDTGAIGRLELGTELRRALARGELCLHYQPIVELATGRIREVEALVRWHHPTRGWVPPLEFIPLAEAGGLIDELGLWILREACQQGCRWHEQYPSDPPMMVSINLSALQLRNPRLATQVAAVLAETGFPAHSLTLEVTETVLMDDSAITAATIGALKAMGVAIAIDDFGTGYSSLSYLRRFPIDSLKIDRSFIAGLALNQDDLTIVEVILALARTLQLGVIAEGIETADQVDRLCALGCAWGQGYHLARPLPPEGLAERLASQQPAVPADASLGPAA